MEVSHHEASTRERYVDLIRLCVAPNFGATAAGKIDAELLEVFEDLERLIASFRRRS